MPSILRFGQIGDAFASAHSHRMYSILVLPTQTLYYNSNMAHNFDGKLERFQNLVGIKFQLYNSLFLSLPFYGVDKTGILLSLFSSRCEEEFDAGRSPMDVIDGFFAEHEPDKKIELLFRFVQYIERQVVLFDALEDAAFPDLNNDEGRGTLAHLRSSASQAGKMEELKAKLAGFSVR